MTTDRENHVFKVGMEFKTHDLFREAVKEHSIKWGKKVKFVKSDREKVRAICKGKKGCPWLIYASYVPVDAVYRIKMWHGNDQFEVKGPRHAMYKVHITNRSCGCRKWDLCGISCIHAIDALIYDIYEYVHDCYKVDTYLKIYSNLMNPINGKDLWSPTNNYTLVPPDVEKRLGRPKRQEGENRMSLLTLQNLEKKGSR
ncbi:hypothetical protein Vadar_021132 [Vaccinium darrowii]|uniref:Uncharacterized protein n=1 Tax=Vaccinium darrowii TaxID=229202 RepID=A0ACB7XB78_9ERIC|nr:hypothetical protein Vadar_021132 [Vaccinium darrowii]